MKSLLLLALPALLVGCHTALRQQNITAAEAVVTLSNDWVEEGEDEVALLEEGTIRLLVPLRQRKSARLQTSTVMKRLAISFSESGRFIEFLAGIRSDHTYTIRCNPCCFLLVDDAKEDPYESTGEVVFTDSSGGCPDGLIPLFPGLAEDPEGKYRCVPAPRIRFHCGPEIPESSSFFVAIGEGLGNDRIPIVEEGLSGYHTFDIVRSGTPIMVRLTQNEQVCWEGLVVFRVNHAYTLEYYPSGNPSVSIILDD